MNRSLRFKVLQRDNFACRYCGRKAPEAQLHVDHILPKARGGRDTLDNLVAACSDCNWGKRDRMLDVALTIETAPRRRRRQSENYAQRSVCRFEIPPVDLDRQLARVYRHDSNWISDFEGRDRLFAALGMENDSEGKSHDDWFKQVLRDLPVVERWVVERRTGLWLGTTYSTDFADIGLEIGESAARAQELFGRGIRRLRQDLGLAAMAIV